MKTLAEQIAELNAKQPSAWLSMPLECPDDIALPLYVAVADDSAVVLIPETKEY
jgi:hypothetical protein